MTPPLEGIAIGYWNLYRDEGPDERLFDTIVAMVRDGYQVDEIRLKSNAFKWKSSPYMFYGINKEVQIIADDSIPQDIEVHCRPLK